MKYQHTDYDNFLNTEFENIQNGFEQIVNTKASILKNRGEVFVGLFQKLSDDGMAIFKIPTTDNMPRKNSFWNAVLLKNEMAKPCNWGELSWNILCQDNQIDYSEAHCVWLAKCNDDPRICLIGINHLAIDFIERIVPNSIIVFGPQIPPLRYLLNLIDIVSDPLCVETQNILDYEENSNQWNPQKIEAKTDFASLLLNDMKNNNCVVVQGPPGTGKTYRMAQLAAKLLEDNKSVLVTALTNQALMELAKKDNIKPFLERGKVSKTSLTVDESRDLPKLLSIKDNLCNASRGYLSLATFYLSSGWAKEASDKPFDYVIMDEASQALLPMIAATMKLGEKIILIGDQNQLSPIVVTNEDIINRFQWTSIVKGFETICQNF